MANSSCCRLGMATLAAFVAGFAFDFLYHGQLLMPLYESTASLWRPMEEMEAFMPLCIAYHAAMAFLFSFLFSRHYEGKGIGEGVRFGLYVGLILGVSGASAYIHLPIPLNLAIGWFVGGVLYAVASGVAIAFVFGRPCKTKPAA